MAGSGDGGGPALGLGVRDDRHLRPADHEVWHLDGLPDENGLITIGVAARHIKVTKTGFRAAVPLPAAWVERYQLGGANGEQRLAELRAR